MKRTPVSLLLALIVTAGVSAQEAADSSSYSFADHFEFSFSPRIIGATLGGRYSLEPPAPEEVETSLLLSVSGAYESLGYYRAPDGDLFGDGVEGYVAPPHRLDESDPAYPAGGYPESGDYTTFRRWDTYWELGVQQGILPRSDIADDLAVVFAYYRGRFSYPYTFPDGVYNVIPFLGPPDTTLQLFPRSGLAEADGSLEGSVHAGVAYSDVVDSPDISFRKGVRGDLVVEWGPPFLHNGVLGEADYTRLSLSGRGYLPLRGVESASGGHAFATYLAGFAAVDWASGPVVPFSVRSSFGLRSDRPGLGGSVRGFESGRFDATLKMVANAEVRVNLPGIPIVAPELWAVVFTDAGYYNDLAGFSTIDAENQGYLLSSGLGLWVDVFGVVPLVFYTNALWPLPGNPARVDEARWQPFSLGFGFHY